jgi:signal transduction histidine kinase
MANHTETMYKKETQFSFINKPALRIVGILVVLFLSVALLWYGNANSMQAAPAMVAQIYFDGEYRIADGPWQKIEKGKHISATEGDVTLRGNFHMLAPDGEYVGIYVDSVPIALYTNHINLTFYEGDNEPFVIDVENPLYGDSACYEDWTAYVLTSGSEDPIEILIHNPHHFGNETAIDEMLSSTALWLDIEFEKGALESGKTQRDIGLLFAIISLIVLGTALFATLIHIKNNKIIWLFGAVIFFAGTYLLYSAEGISYWNESVVSNTTILGCSMMFYMLFLSVAIVHFLKATKTIGIITGTLLGIVDAALLVFPILTDMLFYDTWIYWAAVQILANVILLGCLVREFFLTKGQERWVHIGSILPLIAFGVDVIMTALGGWKGGIVSTVVFAALFAVAMVVILRTIPRNINAAAKAKELELQSSRLEAEKNMVEAELKESRISIMLSQIQPHFIYNTLGTIERMCLKDPQKAFELVRNFSLYLRGNFSELDSVTPIRFVEELKHIEYYVTIEKVRFPDMNIEYDVEATEFVLPALSVQPLVENAIKHGLMRLETGGTVKIHSYETATHFCVAVTDDGAGFDPNAPMDEKKHVGLRNIRGRLKAMVDGELILESKPGVGTKAMIMIPKEVTQ